MAKLKILNEGETDINSTEIWRYSIHSDYPNVKIIYQGSQSFVMSTGQWDSSNTFTHNLWYIPIVYGWLERSGKTWNCNMLTGISDVIADDGVTQCTVNAYCLATATTVTIGAYNKLPTDAPALTNYTFTAHWKIAVDEI